MLAEQSRDSQMMFRLECVYSGKVGVRARSGIPNMGYPSVSTPVTHMCLLTCEGRLFMQGVIQDCAYTQRYYYYGLN